MNLLEIENLPEILEKIEAFIPKIKPALSGLVDFVENYKKKNKVPENNILFYNISFNRNKVFFVVLQTHVTKSSFEVDGVKFEKGSAICYKQLFAIELMQYVEQTQQKGLMHLITELMINEKMKNILPTNF